MNRGGAIDARSPLSLTLLRPDGWHVHLRDGALLSAVAPYTARSFARAAVRDYRDRILAAVSEDPSFEPLMTAYLTDAIAPDEIAAGFIENTWVAAKLYPAKAAAHSDSGITSIAHIMPVLEKMTETGMPLLIHGEVTDPDADIFDRESRVIGVVRSFARIEDRF